MTQAEMTQTELFEREINHFLETRPEFFSNPARAFRINFARELARELSKIKIVLIREEGTKKTELKEIVR